MFHYLNYLNFGFQGQLRALLDRPVQRRGRAGVERQLLHPGGLPGAQEEVSLEQKDVKCSRMFWFGFLGSLVSKDGRSNISRILMPSPAFCRVVSQDPSSRYRYPPLKGIQSRSSQQPVFGSANATD